MLVCIVRDNAANMTAGMRVAGLVSSPCLAHTLQLIIKDGIFQQPSVQQLLASSRSLVGFYNRSNTALNTFQQIQAQLGLPNHRLIQDISTRWNSSFYMLQRIIEQKRAVTVASTECHPPSELSAQQWIKVVKVLMVFEEATREVSGNYASSSVIIPILNTLKVALTTEEGDEGIMRMKRGMLKSLQDRYQDVEQNPLCALASALDPRFKLKVFSSASSASHARMLLTTQCEQILLSYTQQNQTLPKRLRTDFDSNTQASSSTLWNIFDDMMDDPESDSNDVRGYTAEVMVEMYLKEPIINRKCHIDPLNYWKEKKMVWNGLAIMASKYLSIPPSSASSERLFSSAADIISQERNRLNPDRAEMLLFLKKTYLFLTLVIE